jgi:AcrR family transcriptional regulator
MPKVSEARLEARRAQILAAAVECFARRGFHETTMADIAREAGITAGAIYRYFPSKEDVVEASARARREARAARYRAASQRGGTLQVLDELVELTFARAARPDAFMRLAVQLYGEALRNRRVRETVRELWSDNLSQLEGIVRHAQLEGEINPVLEPSAVARVLMATYEGLVVHKTIDPGVDVEQCTAVLRALYRGDFRRGDRPVSDGETGADGKAGAG